MPPRSRSRSRSRSSASSRASSRRRSSAARNRARAASRARSRARAASAARSSRSATRTGSRTGGASAAARRRDAARSSARRAAAASAARSSRSGARTGSRTTTTSGPDKFGVTRRRVSTVSPRTSSVRGGRGRTVERPGARTAARRQRTALSRSAGERGRGASTSSSQGRLAAQANQARQRARNLGNQRRAAAQRAALSRSAGERGRGASASLSQGRLAAEANQARQRARSLGNQRRSAAAAARNAAANKQAAQSLLGAGYRNVAGDRNRSTLGQQFMSGIRNLMRGELGFVIPPGSGGTNTSTDDFKRGGRKGGGDDGVVTTDTTTETTPVTEIPPELIDEFPPVTPPPQYPGMGGGLGGFGYSPALMAYESQQGAGQVPYYMAAARNAMTPNMSPAFMHAARNYDILGGMQRTRARPIEMMSARERAEIMNMGSNFNVPNYNSPYPQDQGVRDFNYFRNMVSSGGAGQPADYAPIADMFPKGPPARFGGPGKGAARPMSQDQVRAMGSGLGSLMRSGMMGMF